MKRAVLFKKLKDKKAQCNVCQHRCNISPKQYGYCQTRVNKNGEIYSEIYGIISGGIQLDPIEKKPMYHLYPGTIAASIGSFGCNFRCRQCLNWQTVWGGSDIECIGRKINIDRLPHITMTPKDFVAEVLETEAEGIAFTYNEPTLWIEYVRDCAKLAKKEGLYTVFVTNGFITPEGLDYIGPFIDGYSVDFKGFSDESYKAQGNVKGLGKIPEAAKMAKEKWGMVVEITTLVIPKINDKPEEIRKMIKWIKENLGINTPLHFSRYAPELAPDKEFRKLPQTSIKRLKHYAKVAKEEGLNYVYLWATGYDLPGGYYQEASTFCPHCKKEMVARPAHSARYYGDEEGKCSNCGFNLDIRI